MLSIKNFEKIKLLNMVVRNHIILSNTYYDTKQYHKAIKLAHEGLRIDKQTQGMSVESFLYNYLSQSYLKLENLDSALFYSEKAANTSKKINSLATKMNTFYQLGIVYFQANKVNEAIKLLDSSLFFALKVGDLNVQHNVYQYLALCYKKLNNKDKCIEYMERQLLLRDSLGVINNLNSINEQRIMFDTEEKEKELLKSENNLQLIALESKRKTTILLISLLALIFSISFAVIALINYLKSKKAAKYIEQQKDQLEEKQKEILDSIRYAKRIQSAHLPNVQQIKKMMKINN